MFNSDRNILGFVISQRSFKKVVVHHYPSIPMFGKNLCQKPTRTHNSSQSSEKMKPGSSKKTCENDSEQGLGVLQVQIYTA